jgi:urocanate hydratase
MSVYTTVFTGSTPIGNGLTGGLGGLWGTPAALAMNGAVTIAAEVVAAIALLRGAVPHVGDRAGTGGGPVLADAAEPDATVSPLD